MLSTTEVAVFESFLDSLVAFILERFATIRAAFSTDETFKIEMRFLESQGFGDKNDYSGYIPKALLKPETNFLAGGLTECVSSNLLYKLANLTDGGLSGSNLATMNYPVVVLALRKAMSQNEDLKIFVRALMIGAGNHRDYWKTSGLYKSLEDMF